MLFKWLKYLVKEIEIEKESCLRKYNYLNCRDCLTVCSKEAITLNPDDIAVNKEKCSSCGLCRTACPAGAIKYNSSPYGFIKGENYFYLCETSVQKGYSSCLGWLDTGQILSAFSREQVNRVVLSPGDCQNCIPGVMNELEKKVDICNGLLSHFYGDRKIVLEKFLKNSFNRQEIIDFFKDKVFRNLKSEYVLPVLKKLNYKSERDLLTALKSLGEVNDEYADSALLPWGELEIDSEKCDFCGACFKLCPTGSLNSREEDDSSYIFQKPSECSKCKLCVEVCCKNALKFLERNNLKYFIEEKEKKLIKKEKKNCLHCGGSFIEFLEDVICTNCRSNEIIKNDVRELMKSKM